MLREMEAAIAAPETQPAGPPPVLRLERLSKTFGGTRALRDVTLEIAPGEVHALVGQNGCGKSTLIKTLAGYHAPDPGALAWLDGEPFELSGVGDRHDRLRFVHQDLGLVTELSAVDNLALSRGYARTRLGSIDWAEQERTARALIGRFGMDIDVHRPLKDATPVECTVVAIAAALEGWTGGGVLVLDEPTAVLPHTEVERLLEIVREVRRGGTSVLYVSHRMNEIFDIADRVTVLRGGRVIGTRDVAHLTPQALATMMVGEDVDLSGRREAPSTARPAALEARDVHAGVLRGVSFAVGEGEVLGIAGLPGSGRETLPYALAGAWPGAVSGAMRLPAQSDAWIDLAEDDTARIPLVPANRTTEGVIGAFSVKENLTLPMLGRLRGRGRARPAARGRPRRRLDRPPRHPHRGLRRADHDAQRRQPAEGRHGALPCARLAGPRPMRADRRRRHRHADAALRPRRRAGPRRRWRDRLLVGRGRPHRHVLARARPSPRRRRDRVDRRPDHRTEPAPRDGRKLT